jgi:2,3-bisphosphoglycerate-independent phosphoglycerate mutase
MADLSLIAELATEGTTKIVLLVMDGLGGMPVEPGGPTELEAARTPNMDRLAAEGTLGLHIPVRPGLAPGSGYAHLALFGYDPLRYPVGRGVLEALGIGFPLEPHDIAARGNFVTVDAKGRIVDRRAGRIPTEVNARLVERLRTIRLEGVEVRIEPVKEHRFVLVLRGEGLSPALTETDPGKTGVPPLPVRPLQPEAERTAALVNRWIEQARALLADAHPANMVTLRGFDRPPHLPPFSGDV